jgi:cell division GTPase FtsZ
MDDKFTKTTHDSEKLKRELKLGFENVQESIVALQKVVDGKIRLSEDKLEKELDKIRKMVVLM